MTDDQYVSLEVARLLKEKGYDEWCRSYWGGFTEKALYMCEANRGKAFDYCNNSMLTRHYNDYDQEYIAAPSLQEAMKWLRDNYKLQIWVEPSNDKEGLYNAHVVRNWWIRDWAGIGYSSWEKATNEAILYCLKFLVKNE